MRTKKQKIENNVNNKEKENNKGCSCNRGKSEKAYNTRKWGVL